MKTQEFKIKALGSELLIEGMANPLSVDREDEIIPPGAWLLDDYKKNPVVFFDHGKDVFFGRVPVGKCVAIEPRDSGLFVQVKISNSKNERISAIRDLIEEGILKTFSPGFNPLKKEKYKDNPKITVITLADLLEVSVVPLPMHQDATFEVMKSYKSLWKTPLAKKWYDHFLNRVTLVEKGAYFSAAVYKRLNDMTVSREIESPDHLLEKIAKTTGISADAIKGMIYKGESIPDEALALEFSKSLGMSAEVIKNLVEGKADSLEAALSQDEKVATVISNTKGVKNMDAEDCVIHQILISKSAATSADEAKAKVEAVGHVSDKMSETETDYVFEQYDGAGLDLSKAMTLSLSGGVKAHCAPVKEVAVEEPAAEEIKADPIVEEPVVEEPIVEDQVKEDPIKEEKALDTTQMDDNPYLELARQTNIMLGALIKEVQTMSEKLNGIADLSLKIAKSEEIVATEDVTPVDDAAQESELASKSLDLLRQYQSKLESKFKRLNV